MDHCSTSWYTTFLVCSFDAKMLRLSELPVRDAATYNMPCEKHAVERSTPMVMKSGLETYSLLWQSMTGLGIIGSGTGMAAQGLIE